MKTGVDWDVDNMYCGRIKRGDVLVCEHEGEEKTVVVLQDDILNGSLPTILGALLDLRKDHNEFFANEVWLDQADLWVGARGVCMLHKLVTIDRRTVRQKKKELSRDRLKQIYAALDVNLGKFRDDEF